MMKSVAQLKTTLRLKGLSSSIEHNGQRGCDSCIQAHHFLWCWLPTASRFQLLKNRLQNITLCPSVTMSKAHFFSVDIVTRYPAILHMKFGRIAVQHRRPYSLTVIQRNLFRE